MRPRLISLRDDTDLGLFPYQADLSRQIRHSIDRQLRSLVSLPTGAGKTRTALHAFLSDYSTAASGANAGPLRWVWMAPTLELLDQARGSLQSLWQQARTCPDMDIAFRGSSPQGANIWFTTPQAVNRAAPSVLLGTRAAVFDEAHQLGAPTFKAAAQACERAGATLIGLSATPGRSVADETDDLVDFFDRRLLVSKFLEPDPIAKLQEMGILAKLRFRPIGPYEQDWTPQSRLRGLAWLSERLHRQGRRLLVFAATVAEGMALDMHLRAMGLRSAFVDGTSDEIFRAQALHGFQTGEVRVLINNRLLATGYDCPAVADVALGTRVNSPVLFEQMVGRAARGPLTGGSAAARVWQFDDHLALHGLPSSYYRYSAYDWTLSKSAKTPK